MVHVSILQFMFQSLLLNRQLDNQRTTSRFHLFHFVLFPGFSLQTLTLVYMFDVLRRLTSDVVVNNYS